MGADVTLEPVDVAEVTIVVDNAIDILVPSSQLAARPTWGWDLFDREQLRAEHGYCLMLTTTTGGRTESLLYDAGLSRDAAAHNLDVLDIDPAALRTLVLSHGHPDHHGGLEGLVGRLGRRMPLVLHPDAWRERKIVFPTGAETRLPPPSQSDLSAEGWEIVEERGPSLLLDGSVLITGQVERVTEFETGLLFQQARVGDGWEPDTWTWDDQAAVVHVRGKGLIILSGCSHSGMINIIRHAQRITGIDRVHAIIGGLHLSGALFEPIISRTIDELATIAPDVIVPGHCTGWKASHRVVAAMPDAYVMSNVGTRLRFAADG